MPELTLTPIPRRTALLQFVVFTNGDRGARVYERAVRSLTGVDHPAFLWL